MIGSIFYCLEIGSTKQIFINYYGLPASAIIGFFILSLVYRIIFKKKKIRKDLDEGKIKEKEIEKEKKIE